MGFGTQLPRGRSLRGLLSYENEKGLAGAGHGPGGADSASEGHALRSRAAPVCPPAARRPGIAPRPRLQAEAPCPSPARLKRSRPHVAYEALSVISLWVIRASLVLPGPGTPRRKLSEGALCPRPRTVQLPAALRAARWGDAVRPEAENAGALSGAKQDESRHGRRAAAEPGGTGR